MSRDKFFPKHIQLAAQHSQRRWGVPAAVTLAQWALESAYGRYLSGTHNPFGIKATYGEPGRMVTTWEVYNGRKVVLQARFRNFATIEDAFNHHGAMLMNPRGYYTRAHGYAKSATWRHFIRAISPPHRPAYATDPAYARKLEAMVDRWRLYEINLADPA